MEDDNEILLEALNEINQLPRQHASFYNWPDKKTKEAGIVDDFLDPNHHCGMHSFTCFELEENDPPDAWVFDSSGGRTALEIVELVNEKAIRAQIKGDLTKYWVETLRWRELGYFKCRVNEIVSEKDKKCGHLFAEGAAVQLLLHSDETYVLTYCHKHLKQGLELTFGRFERVWLLLSYDPKIKKCPLMELT